MGTKTNSPTGLTLEKTKRKLSVNTISIREPRYWPATYDKSPNLLDFAIIKGMNQDHFEIQSSVELSSDHSPVLLKYLHKRTLAELAPLLCTNTTNWGQIKNNWRKH